ncbi:MAG: MBL fold metallo-hydrolase [Gemmatimonadetes bacterium]|uniref:MBL fold metallo-hydrolase n=1 Tax=Candidatus Kutchimonas denitrificans TaxID=3056748 RepID=A0AAE4Z9J3_9BACT|nr:MBL fold metallo-hydrolase [Gemmatimonadota bacterium]NIR76148.1 MBL fold metallo-hydrolase [Candidatus Kutchimonas denitrificans]NIS00527.1 MBL fold metallo-hydrolase [Gemmatimonadota bacterium]NIT66185.1 MBL fold metallo-hydrolase [Gemmatimonadota bacterium]NIU54263.1 MBL fold metallo-hydrolase [Gemmatimonadota bacterium]
MFPPAVSAVHLVTLRSRLLRQGVWVYRVGPWLIDTGPAHARRQLLGWSGSAEADGCLISHGDEDHVGNAGALQRRGIVLRAPPEVLAELNWTPRLPLYRRWAWGTPEAADVLPLHGPVDRDGWRLVPIHTPGHSADHFVYHEPERALVFSADLYVAARVPVARPRENVGRLIDSLRRVRELEPEMLFCAHRGPIDDPAARLTAKLDWLEELVGRARELAGRGWETRRIARRLLGREGVITWVTGGEYSKANLIEAALADSGSNGPGTDIDTI